MTRIGTFAFSAPLWLHPGADAWHFVTVPQDAGDDIRELAAGHRRGFGSVRVAVTVGDTAWHTSIFPQTGTGGFVLPMKQSVRRAERLQAGDLVAVTLEILDL